MNIPYYINLLALEAPEDISSESLIKWILGAFVIVGGAAGWLVKTVLTKAWSDVTSIAQQKDKQRDIDEKEKDALKEQIKKITEDYATALKELQDSRLGDYKEFIKESDDINKANEQAVASLAGEIKHLREQLIAVGGIHRPPQPPHPPAPEIQP
jgi:septal ring factor EnvC (AmiA/AmiB activator)